MKESGEFKEMLRLVESVAGERNEKSRLAKILATHRATMANIGSKDVTDPAVVREAGDAQLGISLVEARLARLKVPGPKFAEIEALHHLEIERYNAIVAAARDAAVEKLVKSQLPFFNGSEVECRDWVGRLNPPHPMLQLFWEATADQPSGPPEERDITAEVNAFVARRAKYSKGLGLD